MKIITVNREFGSGGRELAKRLADALGFAYYDTEIISALAQEIHLDQNYLENALDKVKQQNFPLHFSRSFTSLSATMTETSRLLAIQHKLLKRIAEKENCVIVGRASEIALEEFSPFKIFVYASLESKLKRCQERSTKEEQLSEKELLHKIKEIDHYRAKLFSMVSTRPWGEKTIYDLCINTTNLPLKRIIPTLAQYIRSSWEGN